MDREQVILTLLDDTDRLTVAEAMRLALNLPKPLEFIANHQDDDNPRIRRHVQQMNFILYSRGIRQRLIAGMQSHTLSFWDGLQLVGILSDPRANENSLAANFETLVNALKEEITPSDNVSTGEMLAAVKGSILHVMRGFDYFDVFNLYLTDIYESGSCHPLVLCEIVRQLGIRFGWYSTVVIYGGMYMLHTPEGDIISPDNDWNVVPDITINKCHTCTNEEMLMTYMGLIHTFAIITRRPVGLYNFTQILASVQNIDMEQLPYPLGNVRYGGQPADDGEENA